MNQPNIRYDTENVYLYNKECPSLRLMKLKPKGSH